MKRQFVLSTEHCIYFDKPFYFLGFPYQKLQSRTLYMQVLDYDRFSRDDPIGEVAIPLSDIDLAQGQTFWKSLQPCKGHAVSRNTVASFKPQVIGYWEKKSCNIIVSAFSSRLFIFVLKFRLIYSHFLY